MIVQKLLPSDFVHCRLFCERMLEIIVSDNVILVMRHISIWMVMSISKTVDFGLQRTRDSYSRDLSILLMFSVWCGISKVGIIGPYFFEEEGAIVTLTSERYVEMLRNFLRRQL